MAAKGWGNFCELTDRQSELQSCWSQLKTWKGSFCFHVYCQYSRRAFVSITFTIMLLQWNSDWLILPPFFPVWAICLPSLSRVSQKKVWEPLVHCERLHMVTRHPDKSSVLPDWAVLYQSELLFFISVQIKMCHLGGFLQQKVML